MNTSDLNYDKCYVLERSPAREAFEVTALMYSAWYQKFLPADKTAKILDVGCGKGPFLYFLEKEGFTNYWGIDVSAEQVEFTRNNVTGRVTVADVFDYLTVYNAFDVIAANDILEHIPKDKTLHFLALAHQALEQNGLLLVKTPNMSNPFGLGVRYRDYAHEIGFTEESLTHVLSISGFQEIRIMGAFRVVHSFKSLIGKLNQHVAHGIIRGLLIAQGYGNPHILDLNLIAICTKK